MSSSSFRIEAKNHDYDRYLCSLFVKADMREDVWVVLAFAAELARIVSIASEPTVAAIRLKWWQEALANLPNLPAAHASPPLLIALQGVLARHTIPTGLIDQMIAARMMEVEYPQGFDNQAMFERYLNGTCGALHEWLAWMVAPEKTQTHRGLIYESASMYAMVGLLRAMPYDARSGIVRWPILHTPEAVGAQHWLNQIRHKQFTHHHEIKTLPKFHRKLHAISQVYAKALWHHRDDMPRMPKRLGWVPWQLMLS